MATAQVANQTLYGTVRDKDTKQVLIGVVITISNKDTTLGTTTDTLGRFSISDIPVGTYSITSTGLGYDRKVRSDVIIEGGNTHDVYLYMKKSVMMLDEVVVGLYKDPTSASNDMAVISSRSISPSETKRFAGSLNDPSRMALSYAGVNSGQGDNNEIIIRGNSPKGLQWRLEGIEIPNPNHFGLYGSSGGLISILNSNNMGRSDFYLGSFPAQYGNALSGIFDLQLRNGNRNKRLYSVETSSLGLGASIEGPFKKGKSATYIINYRYSTLGLMKRLGVFYQAPDFQDLTFKINLPTKKKGQFTLYGLGGVGTWLEEDFYRRTDSTQYSISTIGDTVFGYKEIIAENLQRYNLGIVGLKHKIKINAKSYLSTNINYSITQSKPTESDINRDDYSIYLKNKGSFSNTTVRVQSLFKSKINAKNRIETGVVASFMSFKSKLEMGNNAGKVATILDKQDGTSFLQHYAAWQYLPTTRWSINIGVHTSYFTQSKELIPEPRLGVKYSINERSSISLGVGLHSKHESPEAYFGITQHTQESPNLNMKMNRSAQSAIGYKHRLGKNLYLTAELYYQYLYNIPVAADSSYFSLLNEEVPFTNIALINEGEGYNYGAELTIEKRFASRYYFLITSSFYKAQYKYLNTGFTNTKYNNGYVLNIVGGKEFKVKKRSRIGVNFRGNYSGGKRVIPIDLSASVAQGVEVRVFSKAYTQQLDPYIGIDMSMYYKWSRSKATHTIKLDVFRLYEQNYYDIQYQGEHMLRGGAIAPPQIQTLAYGQGQTNSTIFPVLSYRVTFE